LERSGYGLIEVIPRNLSGGTEENYDNPQSCPGRELNRAPPEYKFRGLSLLTCSIEIPSTFDEKNYKENNEISVSA
jgi:hypothetical protein